jgi:hypothetical protein
MKVIALQRTLTGRFEAGNGTGPFAFVRKQGLQLHQMMSRMGDQRCAYTGSGVPAGVGIIATDFAGDANEPAQVAVLVWNSADVANRTAPSSPLNVTIAHTPFAANQPLRSMTYLIDDAHGNPYGVWQAQGAPQTPSTAQLIALWQAGLLVAAGHPTAVTADGNGAVILTQPAPPLPGAWLAHLVANTGRPPNQPQGLVAYIKAAAATLLDATRYTEVLVRWDCAAALNDTAGRDPSRNIYNYVVEYAPAPSGPWNAVNTAATDFSCAFVDVEAIPTKTFAGYYRVSAVDYWMAKSIPSAVVAARPWPVTPKL